MERDNCLQLSRIASARRNNSGPSPSVYGVVAAVPGEKK